MCCFITARGIIFDTRRELATKLEPMIGEKILTGEALIEAAYVLHDDVFINTLLDSRYFEIVRTDRRSAKFFLLNNILRDRVIESLRDVRLRQFMSDAKLQLTEDGVSVTFSDDTDSDAKRVLSDELHKRIAASRVFKDMNSSRLNVEDDEMSEVVARFAARISYDLDYSAAFLKTQSHRAIYIPVGLTELRNNRENAGRPELFNVEQDVLEFLGSHGRSQLAERMDAFISGNLTSAFDLHDAKELSSVMIKVADSLQNEQTAMFGYIRCCLFACKSLSYLKPRYRGRGPDLAALYCINSAYNYFINVTFTVDIAFYDFISFSTAGIVDHSNFDGKLLFRLPEKILGRLIVDRHCGDRH